MNAKLAAEVARALLFRQRVTAAFAARFEITADARDKIRRIDVCEEVASGLKIPQRGVWRKIEATILAMGARPANLDGYPILRRVRRR